MWSLAARALLAACLPVLARADVYSLADLSWTLHNENGSIVVPAKVPSQAHLDLLAAGVIEEPLLGQNEFYQRWIVNETWTYTADLTPFTQAVPQSPLQKTLLVFYGLDTVANITVAGHPVAWVDNQFRQYVYDVTDLINSPSEADNNVTVVFESAYLYGLNVTSITYENPLTPDFEYSGFRQYLRKTQSDFGWDWGPAFVPAGIFRPAYLVTLTEVPTFETSTGTPADYHCSRGQVAYSTPNQAADWVVNVTLGVRSLGLSSGPLTVQTIPASTDEPTFVTASMTVPEGVPARWWPADLGAPTLYNVTVTLALGDILGTTIDAASFTVRSGFRTIELLQTPGITPGDQWHFAVNGQEFYTKGTNIIPFDPFYPRISTEKVRWVLESAVLSGQNMLRVWGGGIYQPSDALTGGYDFYSLCDELGILAWSEMIFSDATYPLNDFLLESIAPEVRENVRRINKHPSNVQWAGGNEIENIVIGINQTYANGTHYLDEYVYLFQDFLYDLTYEVQQSVPYTDCSTTNGILSLDPLVQRFDNKTPGYIYGNTERLGVSFHSMPSFYSWEEALTSPEDFYFNSSTVVARDHHPPAGSLAWPNPNAPQGQGQMTMGVEYWLPTPNTTDTNQTFAQWCYSTQIFQSMNMISEIAWYRRGAGLGENNLGALVWQLNDIWQAPSWAAIEYSGRWKVLNYGMASIYTPVVVYPFWTPDNETLDIMVTNDRPYAVNGTARLTWYDWAGNDLWPMVHEFEVPSLNNTVVMSMQGFEAILPEGATPTSAWMLLNVSTTLADGRTYTPASLADAELVDPQSGVAPYAWVDHPSGTVGTSSTPQPERRPTGSTLCQGLTAR
ncbi:glycoside hydrolase superfamily [Fomitopsis serialis]|uniref:glycoside hydrolase superfamily n=1 Tax=Fomitopsis serialis TaxID=139415 RepID=UPI002007E83C|nr:glycoside hydrolase superfamily [Neoantrodia serialis]KAH9932621.1 glycoside hydrolase superfamily [Neoantrodia serialis]